MSRALQRAWDLLAFLLGERAEPPESFDAKLVALLATNHRLDAALAEPGFAAVDPRAHLPPPVWETWVLARSRAVQAGAIRFAALRQALSELRPFPVIAFKGFPAAELRYPSPGARDMTDIDLLVPDSQLGPIMSRLRELGFEGYGAGADRLDRSCFFEWTFEKQGLALDVHRGFTYPARLDANYQGVFDRSLAWPALGTNARLLAPEDAFIAQALQGPLTEFSPNAFPWIGMLDLREMLKPGPFWRGVSDAELDRDLVWKRAADWKVQAALGAALAVGGTIFAPLREMSQQAVRSVSPVGRARSYLGSLGLTPPRLEGDPAWVRMVRRFFFTPPPRLPAVGWQSAQRWWLHRGSRPPANPGP